MCGIFVLFGPSSDINPIDKNRLKHRGPDAFNTGRLGKCYMEFSRLSINDVSDDGLQPFSQSNAMVVCNGEIYNHKDFDNGADKCDCKCLIPLIQKVGIHKAADSIRGVFAICYTDGEHLLAARDPFGVRPLFYARMADGTMMFSSEIKALYKNDNVKVFPPGHIYDSRLDKFINYYPCYWGPPTKMIADPFVHIREKLFKAVERRITNSDRDICFLLSGGLDSSLMVAIARHIWGPERKIFTFSIGTDPDSPDCKAARLVSDALGTVHTEVIFDPRKEGLDSVYNVVKALETYDTTTIRASVPMWLLSKYIKEKTNFRVVISGEGSDEIFGGYLYFHYAPSTGEFVTENTRRLQLLHQFDVLRSDRSTAAHGLEVRVPFLDRDFVDCAMGEIDQELKTIKHPERPIEKWVLRKAFEGYLPNEILWRQKDAFSDAVGYSWVDILKERANLIMTSEMIQEEIELANGYNTPLTSEEAMYRGLFREFYSNPELISEIWRPKWTDQLDPSATKLNVFKK